MSFGVCRFDVRVNQVLVSKSLTNEGFTIFFAVLFKSLELPKHHRKYAVIGHRLEFQCLAGHGGNW